MAPTTRVEHDLVGDKEVPADAYYGVHTVRAVENFAITGSTIAQFPDLITSLAAVKQAAARANRDLGLLPPDIAPAIIGACEEIGSGRLHEQFVVDPVQGGAGTSTNMNANEVIANRALEILGHPRGRYDVIHPLDHVNLGQSTNDVYPTAVRLALVASLRRLGSGLGALATAFTAKATEFGDVLKMGRTQLQDAVPMTLGQEFTTYAVMIEEDRQRLDEAAALLLESNLGGTAIGTGITGHPRYAELACRHLADISGELVRPAGDFIEATQDCGAFVQLSGVLKRVAVKLSKTCNDLRLLSSGPRAGLGEINLPPVQAGSSIMPGKVNPVIPEVVNQVAFEVIGNDLTVTMAAEAGQLQLNAFEPVIAYSLLRSLTHLRAASDTLTTRCVPGITANREHLHDTVHRSIGLVTALAPHIGYAASTTLARRALATGRGIKELATETGLLTTEQLDTILRPENLTGRAPLPEVLTME
ncbi:aspartate ammonia-lyase [Streptomyces caelestis]|uniref:aspartate ammonia-lyase n=1 Tax=Streptomyces caelestis TaxID=36816 RepID=A0A7W9GXX4_9ACTN|nr:aspartate ammonia-lyase [Streptomyces caelestis]MBB5792107.1 aspartate ammonia-lyase [Streptomyces caelestis]GGW79529.1 aspartate ammonia-lyase [Streptomyces caelestis]